MKKLLFVSALLAGTMSVSAQDVTTKVTGEAGDAKMVYLYKTNARNASDSVKVVNGKFAMDVKMDKNDFAYLVTDNRMNVAVLTDGEPLDVNFVSGVVKGSALNNSFSGLNNNIGKKTGDMYETYQKLVELDKQGTPEAKAQMETLADKLNKQSEEIDALNMKALNDNRDNVLGVFYINQMFREMDFDTLVKYVNKDYKFYNHPMMNGIKKYISNMEKKAPGKMFMDVEIPDLDGKMRNLSDWCGTGKVVLIDFWASWCGPCRQEMPNVVANYNKYKDMGFEVIGISFDQNKEAWVNGVKKLGMEWPQLSELKSWNNKAGQMYGIQSIPSNVLVDKDGKILALDLRGEDLGNKLKEIFGK